MDMSTILGLMGGLALFLYGMQMMSSGLEAAAGNRMKAILEKLTSNRFLGVLVGAVITAVVQSSSATTVMVVGFVNSGLMTLQQAVWIIMGANIGTTVTGLLIALDMGAFAPIFAFIGVALIVFIKNPKCHHYGQILAGLGVLFIGMDMMSGAMSPLRESQAFVDVITKLDNPVLGIIAGAIFTALIQSSSASIGILQTLAANNIITLGHAVFVLFGQNIGTCITAVLASVGASRVAKRTTIIHLMFNIIGTVIFTIIALLTPYVAFMEGLFPGDASMQIAAAHTVFNIATSVLLIPFGTTMAKIATKILPERESEHDDALMLQYIKSVDTIKDYGIGNAAVALNDAKMELERMADKVKTSVEGGFDVILNSNEEALEPLLKNEEYVDFLNKEISKYLSHHISYGAHGDDSAQIAMFFKITGNLERISDHAVNIGEYIKMLKKKKISFSDAAQSEIVDMQNVCVEAMSFIDVLEKPSNEKVISIAALEQKMDDMTRDFRRNQINRMTSGSCSGEACVIYSEMLTDFERIGDHILNIVQALAANDPV